MPLNNHKTEDRHLPAEVESTPRHDAAELEQLFLLAFHADYSTRLQGGANEPFYQPAANAAAEHIIFYREDFFSSALHEVAHWCIAGEKRRQQPDFGYWYTPDGRTAAQQAKFEEVEIKPQAIECIFSQAANIRFRPSLDNLSGESTNDDNFTQAVYRQARRYCVQGLPARAETFRLKLSSFYGGPVELNAASYMSGVGKG